MIFTLYGASQIWTTLWSTCVAQKESAERRVALILGGSGDIGRAVAQRLAAEGIAIALSARSKSALDDAAGAIAAAGAIQAAVFPADLGDIEAAPKLIDDVVREFGRLDMLIAAAGAFKHGDFLSLKPADWTEGFAAMFFGTVRAVTAAWPHLVAARGHLVTVTGLFAVQPSARGALPSAIAGALLNFTKTTAEIGLRDGVSVNSVLPGPTEGHRQRENLRARPEYRGLDDDALFKAYAKRFGIDRLAKPEDVANLVAYLTSDKAHHIQGASIVLDGGFSRLI
jgi:3-oxoacyl-[acyl-carrier protein] reductase